MKQLSIKSLMGESGPSVGSLPLRDCQQAAVHSYGVSQRPWSSGEANLMILPGCLVMGLYLSAWLAQAQSRK